MTLLLVVMSAVLNTEAPERAPSPLAVNWIHRTLTAPDRHVRTTDRRLHAALADGMRRSTTLSRLVFALERTDVIVYIEQVQWLPSNTEGRLMLLTRSRAQRYLRIQVRATLPGDDLIATIGHELQHALEVAESPQVRDEASFREFYERAGVGFSPRGSYDTEAAQVAGRKVRFELRRNV